ncbi:hypothetical protein N4R57_06255 [Rhodobacteraceae bacterium D3-12]|nr:hypothetical protein N4R57_06255 [Rhodobacteraceae bacterium D3-12]
MRPLIAAALILAIATPALAETKRQREKRCTAQSELVAQAVEMRSKRKSEAKTKAALLETADESLAPSVPILVGYVYTLNRKDLKADIPKAFREQCSAFKP